MDLGDQYNPIPKKHGKRNPQKASMAGKYLSIDKKRYINEIKVIASIAVDM